MFCMHVYKMLRFFFSMLSVELLLCLALIAVSTYRPAAKR